MDDFTRQERLDLRRVHKFNGGDPTVPDEIIETERKALLAIRQYGCVRNMPVKMRKFLFGHFFNHVDIVHDLKRKFSEAQSVREKVDIIMKIIDEEYKYFNRRRTKNKLNINFDEFRRKYAQLLWPPEGNFGSAISNEVLDLYWEKYGW